MPTQSSVRSFGGTTWRSTNMVYYNFRVQNCKDSFGNTTNLVFWSNCFLIKLDGNRFQGQTKSLYPVDSIYVNLSYLILNPLWHQVLAPKTCVKYLKEPEIVITTNNNFFKGDIWYTNTDYNKFLGFCACIHIFTTTWEISAIWLV